MRSPLGRVLLYLTGSLLLLTAALAQQKPSAPSKTALAASSPAAKPEQKQTDTKKKSDAQKPLAGDAHADLAQCAGPNVKTDTQVIFKAVDQPYDVVITDNSVFTDCKPILHLSTVGATAACTANTNNLKPGEHRYSQYFAIPPNGAKDCPKNVRKPKKLGGSGPSDITVP